MDSSFSLRGLGGRRSDGSGNTAASEKRRKREERSARLQLNFAEPSLSFSNSKIQIRRALRYLPVVSHDDDMLDSELKKKEEENREKKDWREISDGTRRNQFLAARRRKKSKTNLLDGVGHDGSSSVISSDGVLRELVGLETEKRRRGEEGGREVSEARLTESGKAGDEKARRLLLQC